VSMSDKRSQQISARHHDSTRSSDQLLPTATRRDVQVARFRGSIPFACIRVALGLRLSPLPCIRRRATQRRDASARMSRLHPHARRLVGRLTNQPHRLSLYRCVECGGPDKIHGSPIKDTGEWDKRFPFEVEQGNHPCRFFSARPR